MQSADSLAQGKSMLHRLDPRVKLFGAVGCSILFVLLCETWLLAAGLLFAAALLLTARPSARYLLVRLGVVNAFMVCLWLFLPWSVPGEVIARWAPLEMTREGVARAGDITLRCNSIAMVLLAFLGTASAEALAHAMRWFRLPEKLVVISFFCVRYIHVIHEEYTRLTDAMAIRAFRPGTDMRTYRSYAHLMGGLLVRSYDRSARIYEAMLCRGFSGTFPTMSRFSLRPLDLVVAGAIVVFLAFFGAAQWWMITS